MPRPASTSSVAETIPLIPIKEETRDLVVTEPRYNDRVLEGLWRDRRIERTKACLPPLQGLSIYATSYVAPGQAAYEDDGLAWENRAKSEGVERAVLLEGSGPGCRDNFATTTDLMHRWLPQVCPQLRSYNTRHLEWLPAQDLLPCLGNLTQFGLKEYMAEKWAEERAQQHGLPVTSHRAQFHVPCAAHRETSRKARCRLFSSELQTNNRILYNQRFRGQQVLIAPNVLQGEYPLNICRDRLPIVPELPLEPPRRAPPLPLQRQTAVSCTGVSRCRRVVSGTPPSVPALPYYHSPCAKQHAVL